MRTGILVACVLLLAACGGGDGNGTSQPAFTLTPTTLTATFAAGTSTPLSVTATPTETPSGTYYVTIVDQNGVLAPTVTFTPSAGSYVVGLMTSPTLKAGHYTGSFQANVCHDTACADPVAGSPYTVPFDFTVSSASPPGSGPSPPGSGPSPPSYTLTPGTLTSSFTAGSPSALTITVTSVPAFTGSVNISVTDPSHVLQTAQPVTANGNASYSITVTPLASLAPGHLTGTLSLNLCTDAACASPLTGSPLSVPFDFTVLAPPAALALNPGTARGSFTAGDPFPFTINMVATPQTALPSPVYVSVNDSTGTLLSTASLSANTLTLQVTPSLAAGHYTGSFQLDVCGDQSCTRPVPGSPLVVPFDIQVAPMPANAGLTHLTPWPGVGDWETFQRNAAHTGYVPVTLDPTVFAARWLWTAPSGTASQVSGDSVNQLSTVTVAAGVLYVNSGYRTYALQEFDHSLAWKYDFSPVIALEAIGALNPPAVSGGRTYVTTSGHEATFMFGFDAVTGALQFKTPFEAQWEHYLAPTVDNGTVFEDGGYFGGLYAFDASSGTQSFFTELQQFDEWTPAVDANYAYAYIGGQIADTPAQLNIVDRHTGTLVASINDASYQWDGYSMFCAPVLGQPGSVFAVNVGNPLANALLDFDTNAKTIRWSNAGKYSGNPAYASAVLYAVNKSPYRLEARSETDGSLLWSWAPQQPAETEFIGDVLVTNNLVFVSTNLATYAIDLTTHQPVWSIPRAGHLTLSANGVLYIVIVDDSGQTNGTVLAINVKT